MGVRVGLLVRARHWKTVTETSVDDPLSCYGEHLKEYPMGMRSGKKKVIEECVIRCDLVS